MMGSQNHLTALPLELHTHILSNLQPYDIFQVLQTCRALYLASSQRRVWMDALHRICVENTLFEPSFPVANMSVLELQRASMGPHRWIARLSSKEHNSNGVPPHSVTRHLMSAMSDLFITDLQAFHVHYLVPGGRYMFSLSRKWLVLWDLGPPYSSGGEPHSIATVPVKFSDRDYLVHSTPDGMGLRIFLLFTKTGDPNYMASFSIYEIYPESTSPQLTQIAYTLIPGSRPGFFLYSLSYDRLIFTHGNILTVWDYKANMWARWGVEGEYSQILTTKSAVILIRPYGVSVWEIPTLFPESSLSMSTNPSVMSPVFELEYPENDLFVEHYQAPCGWYSGTPQPLYYDVHDLEDWEDADPLIMKIKRFEVGINSKISGGTLNLLNTFEVPSIENYYPINARICQDKNASIWIHLGTGCFGTHVADIYDPQLPSFFTTLYHPRYISVNPTFCPATGRVVHCELEPAQGTCTIIVLDF